MMGADTENGKSLGSLVAETTSVVFFFLILSLTAFVYVGLRTGSIWTVLEAVVKNGLPKETLIISSVMYGVSVGKLSKRCLDQPITSKHYLIGFASLTLVSSVLVSFLDVSELKFSWTGSNEIDFLLVLLPACLGIMTVTAILRHLASRWGQNPETI